jgi:hypothetical protein
MKFMNMVTARQNPPTSTSNNIPKNQRRSLRPLFSQNYTRPSLVFSFPPALILNNFFFSFSLLERPENHHMIRWDPAGEHIIVERPEQLALHVLPSIYRQSRFASFSRQLNVKYFFCFPLSVHLSLTFPSSSKIYGFMRKVNLRNVDPAIDDPDASTWCESSSSSSSSFSSMTPPS